MIARGQFWDYTAGVFVEGGLDLTTGGSEATWLGIDGDRVCSSLSCSLATMENAADMGPSSRPIVSLKE